MKFGRAGVLSAVNHQNDKKKKEKTEKKQRAYELRDLSGSKSIGS